MATAAKTPITDHAHALVFFMTLLFAERHFGEERV
jgi:hypothetical protein